MNFNSIMVRLKQEVDCLIMACDKYFNSIMVRLKPLDVNKNFASITYFNSIMVRLKLRMIMYLPAM